MDKIRTGWIVVFLFSLLNASLLDTNDIFLSRMYNYGNNPAVPALLKKNKISLNDTLLTKVDGNSIFYHSFSGPKNLEPANVPQNTNQTFSLSYGINKNNFLKAYYCKDETKVILKNPNFDQYVKYGAEQRTTGLAYSNELNDFLYWGIGIENINIKNLINISYSAGELRYISYTYPSYYVYTLGLIYKINENNLLLLANSNTSPQKINYDAEMTGFGSEKDMGEIYAPRNSISYIANLSKQDQISLGLFCSNGITYDDSGIHIYQAGQTLYTAAYERKIIDNMLIKVFGSQAPKVGRVQVDGGQISSGQIYRNWGLDYVYELKEHEFTAGYFNESYYNIDTEYIAKYGRVFIGYAYTFAAATEKKEINKEEEVLRTLQQEAPKTEIEETVTPNTEINPLVTGNIETTGNAGATENIN